MTRRAQGPAQKGSQKWVQHVVNHCPQVLNEAIAARLKLPDAETILWRSPLTGDAYAEYQDQAFLDLLGIELTRVPLADFWPTRGPVWDALGKSQSGAMFLVEAKSHIAEIVSPATAASQRSKDFISSSLQQCKDYLNCRSELDWTGRFYQYTNRLAHLYLLRVLNGVPAYLVFLHFVNDEEMNGPDSEEEWKGAIDLLHAFLGIGPTKLTPFVANVFIDVAALPLTQE